MNKDSGIYIAGHRGMVGSAIVRLLESQGYHKLILRTSKELDLRNQLQVTEFYNTEKPEYVIVAAAKVGGIIANNIYRADFLYDNLAIEMNLIHGAYQAGVKKLLFLGSSCIYPKDAPQPLKEEYLLSGFLESTNEPYAISKIAGIKLCESYRDQYGCNFVSAMPANLYGPNDNYDLQNSHVLPALIRKFHQAKIEGQKHVEIWGSGKPQREFLHVDDLAEACLFIMNNYNERLFLNVGFGEDLSILELAHLVKQIVGFEGAIILDQEKPDGTFRKLLDSSRLMTLGWKPKIHLKDGIKRTYESYLKECSIKI